MFYEEVGELPPEGRGELSLNFDTLPVGGRKGSKITLERKKQMHRKDNSPCSSNQLIGVFRKRGKERCAQPLPVTCAQLFT